MRKIALVALAGALALAACGKKEEDAPAATNNLVEPPVENVIVDEPDAPLPEVQNNAVATPPAPPPSISEQQQIQDDAEATGMTARLPEGGEQSQSADGTSMTGE
ncbi:hypothetical protein Q4610_05510 [Sphingobium sp. HBC34]|uniref:Argininosuccinate lyase n=1 Tax=Sphingobium cyanobacteriorum TaxID=3063954 RepID=A0ABT8ZJG3_9SPHN|nr:hypothetical protein [Sphingobium sp. HBC34]MDO7834498.1 hypothetical protein [Sphingobium sp. HBC34]